MHDATRAFRNAILHALGHAPDVIELGRLQRFPTSDRRSDTSGWCKVFDDGRAGVFGCWRTGRSETWTATDTRSMTRQQRAELARQVAAATRERQAEQRRQWAENEQRITKLWGRCMPLVPGDPATLYLKGRGFAGVWPLPCCLRYLPSADYWHEGERIGTFPALAAPLTAADGRIVALHRTFLTRDGHKAAVPTVRKLTPASGPLTGACIRLHEPQRGVLGVAEGIETALGAWLASSVPAVAAYSAGSLAAWQWPPDVRRIVVFADADRAGREAADTLRARALRAGLQIKLLVPSEPGADWCDVWAQRGAVTVEVGGAA
ncbi:MAG: hypothetical protein ABS84_15555 [Rubrivivax sp. SCN 71-131]|nr:MAG: hypothetical protein ABS84_15555 [Rubrivivax sp. SCN 71-131]